MVGSQHIHWREVSIILQCMEEHRSFLVNCCRLCPRSLKGKIDVAHKRTIKWELWLKFGINVDVDSEGIHPLSICPACRRLLPRVRDATYIFVVSTSRQPFSRKSHNEDCPFLCKRGKTRRPSRTFYKQAENDEDEVKLQVAKTVNRNIRRIVVYNLALLYKTIN